MSGPPNLPGTDGVRPHGARRLAGVVDFGLGLVYLVIAGALVATAILVYDQAFTERVDVELTTGSVGNNLRPGADVKVRGVAVGRVEEVRSTDSGAVLTLAIEPDQADRIPADVTARLLPKTLFGERFVALQVPTSATSVEVDDPIGDGDRITQDTSRAAVELEDVFDQLLPLLTAVQPKKLSSTLSELVTALRGQGESIGDTMTQWADYARRLNPELPQLTDDLGALGRVAGQYSEALPDLLTALDDLSVTSATLVDQRDQLRELFAGVTASGDTTTGWLQANEDTIRVLSASGRRALAAVAPYAEEFPCVLSSARQFIDTMDTTLGADTTTPGLRVEVKVVPSPPAYEPGKDAVTYGSGGPRCPYVPSGQGRTPSAPPTEPTTGPTGPTGESTEQPAGGRAATTTPGTPVSAAGLGPTNSPAENQMTAEVLSGRLGLSPSEFPSWGTLLLGPVLRGAEVTIR